MAQNKVNMSLDEIIKSSNKSTRGRGSFKNRGGSRGGGRGRGRGNARSRSQSRNRLSVRGGGVGRGRGRGRGTVRGRGGRGQGVVGRLSRKELNDLRGIQVQNRSRSASRNRGRGGNNNNIQRARSGSRSRGPQIKNNTQRARSRSRGRINTNQNIRGGRGRGVGISKMNRKNLLVTGISTEVLRAKKLNSISQVGLRSDQIIHAQKINRAQNKVNKARKLNNPIRSQTFTRSRSIPKTAPTTSLTVSVANEFANRRKLNRKRRNSATNQVGYLDKASLEKLTQLLGGSTLLSKGPGSVRSMGSNRSKRSNRSMRSNASKRGRGKKNFSLQRALNPRLQQQIAQIQGKSVNNGNSEFVNSSNIQPGINFTPTPHLTTTSLSERFGKM